MKLLKSITYFHCMRVTNNKKLILFTFICDLKIAQFWSVFDKIF